MFKFALFYIYITLVSQNIYCKKCLTCSKKCDPESVCQKEMKNSTCIEKCECDLIYKDKYNQLMDCTYEKISINLTVANPKPIELFCKKKNMNIIVSSAIYKSSERENDVTHEIRQICALKRFCGYPIRLNTKCERKMCFDEFSIKYFCKETKIEENNCDKFCFNGGKCQQCHTDFGDPTVSQCNICQCVHEPQIYLENNTILNRFCNLTLHNTQIASKAVITGVVFLIILSGAFFALIFVGILYFIRRRKYKNYSNERLLSFPLEAELI